MSTSIASFAIGLLCLFDSVFLSPCVLLSFGLATVAVSLFSSPLASVASEPASGAESSLLFFFGEVTGFLPPLPSWGFAVFCFFFGSFFPEFGALLTCSAAACELVDCE